MVCISACTKASIHIINIIAVINIFAIIIQLWLKDDIALVVEIVEHLFLNHIMQIYRKSFLLGSHVSQMIFDDNADANGGDVDVVVDIDDDDDECNCRINHFGPEDGKDFE